MPYDDSFSKSRIATVIPIPQETGLPSFGEKLKLEREKRNITLEEISSSTKISTRMLNALEEEKFNRLPGGIFNKGFVRAYARAVGLDEDQAVADYLQASGDAQPVRPEQARDESAAREEEQHRVNRLEAISEPSSRPLPWGAFAVILLAIALALSLWSHRRREQERLAAHTPPPTTAVQSSGASSPQSNTTSSASGSGIRPAPVSATTAAPIPAATSSQKTPSPASQKPPSAAGTPATPTVATPTAATAPPGEFTVVIRARELSWISVTVDGKSTPSELLEAGSEFTLHGRKQVVVKVGNAGGLDFRLNGKKLEVGGEFGEVKTVTIGPAGLVVTPSDPPPTT